MSKLHTFLIAATLLFCATAANAERWSVERMNEVVNQTNFIVGSGCSGTLISLKYRLILSAHHCITNYVRHVNREIVVDGVVKKVRKEELRDIVVSQKSYANYRQVGSATWQAVIIARWKESDLALLQIRAKNLPHKIQANVFAGKEVMRGSPVTAVGNPMMLDATVSRGHISSINRMVRMPWTNAETPFIQFTAPIAGGSSGGSLYDDEGRLIGVPVAGSRGGGNIGLAIPFFRIQELLTNNCFREVWDKSDGVKDHAVCVAERKSATKKGVSNDEKANTPPHGKAQPVLFTPAKQVRINADPIACYRHKLVRDRLASKRFAGQWITMGPDASRMYLDFYSKVRGIGRLPGHSIALFAPNKPFNYGGLKMLPGSVIVYGYNVSGCLIAQMVVGHTFHRLILKSISNLDFKPKPLGIGV